MPERHPAAATAQSIQRSGPDEQKSWLDLSPLQVAGGALAAMTAAGLGSRLSVEGTIAGAALASVIAAVASALYTASLRRTSAAVRGVIGGRRTRAAATDGSPAAEPVPSGSTAALGSRSGPARISRRRALVLSSVVGAVAIFALAGVALTLYEAIAGRALSGGGGTTFSQVQESRSQDRPTDEPSAASTDSAEPSESADATPTAETSDTPQAGPAPTAEPSTQTPAEPSAEPSATDEAEPSAGPSAAAEPSAPVEAPSEAPDEGAQTPR